MKKARIFLLTFSAVLFFSILFFACNKSVSNTNSATDEQKAQLTASSVAQDQADGAFDDVFANVMGVNADIGIGGGIGVFNFDRCFTVTITPNDPHTFPKTVVIDFGTGCTGFDGITRRGKIITVYTGPMVLPGSKATTTFDGFYRDSIKVEGTHIVENVSTDSHFIFNIKVENGKLTAPSGNFIMWNKNITIKQIEGSATIHDPLDDVFSITGSGNGTVKKDTTTLQWTAESLDPLIRKFLCRWAIKGSLKITVNGITGILDYGNGDCDNKATLKIGGTVINITLP